MNHATHPTLIESQLLVRAGHCASASLLVRGLPNTVLVQLLAMPFGKTRCFSLYSVYREETMTFDAIYRFAARSADEDMPVSLEETLQDYLQAEDIKAQVLGPLMREVQAHFRR